VGRRDARHGSGRPLRWLPIFLVLTLLLAATASYRFDLGDRWFGLGRPDPSTDPAAVPPPEGLSLPPLTPPAAVARALEATDGALDPARVRRALAPRLADRDLGRHVLAFVSELDEPDPVFVGQTGAGAAAATPASTMKLLTAAAALATLGPEHTFTTKVVTDGRNRIVLVGGGDPHLASRPGDASTYPRRADVVTLARATARALRQEGTRRVRLGYDDSLFQGPRFDPSWPDDYGPDGVVAPITALWVDEGRSPSGFGRVADPPATAAATFAGALARAGVAVVGAPRARRADREAVPLASVASAPLSQIVEQTLVVSDNEASEVLAHHVGLATGGSGSFEAGGRGVQAVLGELGVPFPNARVYDGSGLSRRNRLAPATLTGVLRIAASGDHPELRSVLTGLPVAGFTGSLESRFEDGAPQGRGRVRAKTGTLTGVSSLAGVATDLDGNPMVFVLMADRVALADTLDARDALDAVAAALGACHCGR
jgi:D-alanyl-D-alanine carboxypeptidase/D-alanyl-D-alanine-endopeptidase (penicillin-binding protein 4)